MSHENGVITSVRGLPQTVLGECLLLLRDSNRRVNKNLWELVGGKVEDHEITSHANPEQEELALALERETFEETGLTVLKIGKFVCVEDRTITDGKEAGLKRMTFLACMTVAPGAINLTQFADHSPEHVDAMLWPIDMQIDDVTEVTATGLHLMRNKLIEPTQTSIGIYNPYRA